MIPKILHKIWFGPKQDDLRYSDHWLDHFPDYELKIWDNETLKPYFKEVIDRLETVPKTSFVWVGDILRLLVLRDYGGIYLDHDVEIFRNFDHMINTGSTVYLTFEYPPKEDVPSFGLGTTMLYLQDNPTPSFCRDDYINNNFIVATANNSFIKDCINLFVENYNRPKEKQLPTSDWTQGPAGVTSIAERRGIVLNGETQTINDITVYHRDYFHPVTGIERRSSIKDNYWNQWYNELKNNTNCYTHHDHIGTFLWDYIDLRHGSKEEFEKVAHGFYNWYMENYGNTI